MEVTMKSAKVIRDFLVVFDEPGGVHYTTFLRLGEVVAVLDDERYGPRKQFVKVQTKNNETGYCTIHGLRILNKGDTDEASNNDKKRRRS
jgi:hypothetical protein